MLGNARLSERLAEGLPLDVELRAYHISTPPSPCAALFAAPPAQPEETTHCESHFLTVAVVGRQEGGEILALAIEVLVFTTRSLTTVFVSKADSSGFLARDPLPEGSPSITAAVISAFLEFLLSSRLHDTRVLLSLFARSQNQYLFPGSIENSTKHVLDDRQLIKWWVRMLDTVVCPIDRCATAPQQDVKVEAHLIVPGCDEAETKAFFPPSAKRDATIRWCSTYPVNLLSTNASAPPRCLIPHFPDDPKARFLDDLDGNFIDDQGQWRDVKSLDQFWDMMSWRQECSAGRLVGFVWIVLSKFKSMSASEEKIVPLITETEIEKTCQHTQQPSEHPSQQTHTSNAVVGCSCLGVNVEKMKDSRLSTRSPPLPLPQVMNTDTTPTITLIQEVTGNLAEPLQQLRYDGAAAVHWPEGTRGHTVMENEKYHLLIDHLLQLDFAGKEQARRSTDSWIEKLGQLAEGGIHKVNIVGRKVMTPSGATISKSATQPTVHVLTSIRKKRKANNLEEGSARLELPAKADTINTLETGLVRKKAKS